jgi:hypothetical protein
MAALGMQAISRSYGKKAPHPRRIVMPDIVEGDGGVSWFSPTPSAIGCPMPQPCSVCSHVERAEIDRRLAFQVVNVASLAREYGLGKDAVHRHRSRHLPAFLPAFQASEDALTLGTLQAEARRLYVVTLDALAAAQAGVLAHVDADGTQHRVLSMSAIARMIREARAGLDQLARLAADGADPNERPTGVSNGALDASIQAALTQVVQRGLDARHLVTTEGGDEAIDVVVVEKHEALEVEAQAELVASPPRDPKPSDGGGPPEREGGLDTVTPVENPGANTRSDAKVPHPDYPGSSAASSEERAAAGYPDVDLTSDDGGSTSDQVARLHREHLQRREDELKLRPLSIPGVHPPARPVVR